MSPLPIEVIPTPLGRLVDPLTWWFVIGGQAVRCLCPYRPSRDVDFGVGTVRHVDDLVAQLEWSGASEILERPADTVHLRWNRINVSVCMLDMLVPFTEERLLSVRGILATKLHAILDRGTRRDFFDLYVTLQTQRLGVAEALAAIRDVYRQPVRDTLLLRALTFFDDAEREARLPGEGRGDWRNVKTFFQSRAGALLIPPPRALEIQKERVDVRPRSRRRTR